MFCGKCGKEFDDNTVFCPNCGERLEKSVSVPPVEINSSVERQGKIIGNILRGVVAVAVIVLVIMGVKKIFFPDSYEKLVKEYCKAIEENDGEKLLSLIPDDYIEAALEDGDFENEEELAGEMEDQMKEAWGKAKDTYGDDINFSCEIVESTKDEDRMKKRNMEMEEEYNLKEEISEYYKLELKIKMEGDKGSGSTTNNIGVMKIDGNWYLDPGSM